MSGSAVSLEYVRSRYSERLRILQRRFAPEVFELEWRRDTANHMENFIQWFKAELDAKPLTSLHRSWLMVRLDKSKPFGPTNCKVLTEQQARSYSGRNAVTQTLRNAVKEFYQNNRTLGDSEIAKHFPAYHPTTIRKILIQIREG